jgi:hypothetical protein
MRIVSFSLPFLLASVAGANGVIVYRSDTGLVLSEATALVVNTKDKALSLGPQPNFTVPVNKLRSVRLDSTLVREIASSALAKYHQTGESEYLIPEGTPKTGVTDTQTAWKSAKITFKKSQSDKTPVDVPADKFVAFLPSGVGGLAELCADRRALTLIGGKDGYFQVQMELLTAAVKTWGSHPSMAAVESYVRDSMRNSDERFEVGNDSARSLAEGLQFSRLSEQAYPTLPEHQRLRKELAEHKAWLDKRLAILRALSSGGQWDAFLLAYRPFEKHQLSFPDLMEKYRQALSASMRLHWEAGKERVASGEFRSGFSRLRLASYRQPSNSALQKEVAVAWSEYSQQTAVERRANRKQLSIGQRDAIAQSLHFASSYQQNSKLDDALKSIVDAEGIDPAHLGVLLKKAEILGARREFGKALSVLNEYDQHAVDEERSAGNKLRNELLFQLTNSLRDLKQQLQDAWTNKRYHHARRLAQLGLRSDERDPDILYFAGLSALITRNSDEAGALLGRYLESSNTLDSNPERRASVLRLVGGVTGTDKDTDQGEPNWFSGKRIAAGMMYCPISGAFQAKVDRIAASNKLSVRYIWDGARLRSVVPAFEKPTDATGEKPISFTYDARVPHVLTAQYGDAPADVGSADPDELLKRARVVLKNNPLVDPRAVERLTGERVTLTVAGNRFFHPFVWQRLHVFRLTYDGEGRVRYAREIPTEEITAGTETFIEFEWDGLKLTAVRGYQIPGGDENKRVPIYERKQQYQGERLIGEEIRAGSKTSRIKYTYAGNQLVSAECDKDESLDNRSREVTFVNAGARAQAR